MYRTPWTKKSPVHVRSRSKRTLWSKTAQPLGLSSSRLLGGCLSLSLSLLLSMSLATAPGPSQPGLSKPGHSCKVAAMSSSLAPSKGLPSQPDPREEPTTGINNGGSEASSLSALSALWRANRNGRPGAMRLTTALLALVLLPPARLNHNTLSPTSPEPLP